MGETGCDICSGGRVRIKLVVDERFVKTLVGIYGRR